MKRTIRQILLLVVAAGCASAPMAPATRPADSNPAAGNDPGDAPREGFACPDGKCAPGLICVTYYGAGPPRGPATFTKCEAPH